MAHISTPDEVLAGQWSIRYMLVTVQSMIDEVERHVLQKESLNDGLVQGLSETINNIEAEIFRRRDALSLVESQSQGRDTGIANSQRGAAPHIPPVAVAHKDDPQRTAEQRSPDLPGQSTNKDDRPSVLGTDETADSLQDNIRGIQSVIGLRIKDCLSNKRGKTSSMVSLSILEEEMKILDGLLEHVLGACEPSDDRIGGVLEKLMALPAQLNALFNMEIREVAQEGSEIDEKTMMYMVMENQKRTNVLRHIELVADKVKRLAQNSQGNARSLQ